MDGDMFGQPTKTSSECNIPRKLDFQNVNDDFVKSLGYFIWIH